MKYLKYVGIGLTAILAVYGIYSLVPHQPKVGSISSTTSSLSGGLNVQVSNSGDTFSVGPTQQYSISNTNYAITDNGITTTYYRQAVALGVTNSTTTPCSFAITATSSIANASILSTVGSTTATLTIASSTTAFATTSSIYSGILAGQVPVTWEGGANNTVVGPSTFVNFGLSNYTFASSGYQFNGVCTLVTQTIN